MMSEQIDLKDEIAKAWGDSILVIGKGNTLDLIIWEGYDKQGYTFDPNGKEKVTPFGVNIRDFKAYKAAQNDYSYFGDDFREASRCIIQNAPPEVSKLVFDWIQSQQANE